MIILDRLSKAYDGHEAVHNVSLTIAKGELCVLIGPSGCGKSTLLKLINRMVEPTSGTVRIGGKDVRQIDPDVLRRGIGYVIQNIGLFPHWTVGENIALVPRLMKWDTGRIASRVLELADMMGLKKAYMDRYPRDLSGGEAQRVGVARALAADPPILLMDEPFGALDPLTRERLQKEFLGIQKQLHKTVVFVTHDVDEAIRLADRLIVMKSGQLVAQDDPRGFLEADIPPFAAEFLGQEYGIRLLARYTVDQILRKQEPMSITPDRKVQGDISLKEALSLMLAENTEVLAVVERGAYMGTVHLQDILKIYKERAYAETI